MSYADALEFVNCAYGSLSPDKLARFAMVLLYYEPFAD